MLERNAMKIALCMIVKDSVEELEHLSDCLDSVQEQVDGVFIYFNGRGEVINDAARNFAKKRKVKWEYHEWTNFGDARNKSFAMVPKDYDFILWLDTDDTVVNPEKLKQVALATPKHIDGIYMAYDYAHDQFGNVTVQHYVARMVRNNGSFKWSDKILHESLEPIRHCGKAINEEVRVVHHADAERRDRSLQRNIEMLEKELKGEGSKPDPRTLFYLGTAYIDIGRLDDAKDLLGMYIRLSGWAEERSQAWVHLGNIYEYEDNDAEMRKCYLHALNENPKDPSPYVELAKVEIRNKLYAKAVEWLKMALNKKRDPMTTVHHSTETIYKAYMFLSECYLNLGGQNLDDALKYAQKALEMRPDDITRSHYDSIHQLIEHRTKTEGVMMVLKGMVENEKEKIPEFIKSLPEELRDNPGILRYMKKFAPPKQWPKKSIVIFTGNSILGEWGPWSLDEGIGGSEEAVVRLGRQLKNQGYEVWVYATPGARVGEYDGVHYRNYWELNLADEFDVFVAWRSPWFFDIDMKARKKYLWLHDVMNENEFTKERLERLDKVIVLSQYHRDLYPMIPDDKIFLSTNGIDSEDFNSPEFRGIKRDPYRVIYMSSHVRGLQLIYEIWPEVKKEVPEAKLDIYYGWGSYEAVNRNNPERMEWKAKMQDWADKLEGITDHGKVGQKKIVEETMKSGIWAYPCPFPEISCITAMKAQAGGAIPISSTFAALNETVQFGTKIDMKQQDEKTPVGKWDKKDLEKFKVALIDMLKNPEKQEKIREEMMAWSRKNQSWSAVASQWIKEFA